MECLSMDVYIYESVEVLLWAEYIVKSDGPLELGMMDRKGNDCIWMEYPGWVCRRKCMKVLAASNPWNRCLEDKLTKYNHFWMRGLFCCNISKEPGDWIYNAQMMSPLWTHVRLTCHPPPPKILKTLNACHVFLKVIALVDTTDGTGNLVLPYSLQGIRHSDWWSSYTWPHQIRLLPKAWRTWRKNIYIQFYIAIISNRLQRPILLQYLKRPL